MCGIWAVMAKNNTGFFAKDVSIVEQMMHFTAPRGNHSTGIAITNIKKPKIKPRIWKTTGGPCFMIQNDVWDVISKHLVSEGGVIYGHGRFATKGDVTAKNAHPFSYKNITLVHNGTIHAGVTYEEKDDSPKVDVDSHALCIKMAKEGIKEALTDISGAYAVIVHDADTQSIYFAKNTERPLHIVETTDRFLLMSEKDALEFLLRRNNLYSYTVKSVISEVLYRFDLSTFKVTEEANLKKQFTPTYYNGYSRSWADDDGVYSHNHDRHRTYSYTKENIRFMVESVEKVNDTEYLYEGETEEGKPVEFRTNELHNDLILQFGEAEVAYEIIRGDKRVQFVRFRQIKWDSAEITTLNGKKMTRDKWKELVKGEQCSVCDADIKEDDASKTIVDDKGVVCKDCVSKRFAVMSGDE